MVVKTLAPYVSELHFDWNPPKDDTDENLFQTIGIFLFFFAISFVNDVVPLVIVIDSQFIKILSFEFIREYNKSENAKKNLKLFDSITSNDKK